ncbi:b(0,+)-type amino acid transporter 1-like [Pleurodeles waltl]|uniref:b(0,+)-type amino acid transporter 1-like n=1 Tax=Pleurodeles waltl TaxID=8319 RepID=UPI0037097B92
MYNEREIRTLLHRLRFTLPSLLGTSKILIENCPNNIQKSEGANMDTRLEFVGVHWMQAVGTRLVNLPRAVLIAIPLVTCVYILVNVSYFAAMTPSELLSSGAVAISWGDKVLGSSWSWLIPLAVALSTFGSANGSFFCGGRSCYVAAREGHMPDVLSMAHVHRLTPSPALIFTAVVSLIMIIPGNFSSIVNFFSFTAWLFYGITISGLLYLKIKKPHLPRPYKVPVIIPIIFLVAAVYLVLAPIIDSPQIEFLYVILFILSGIIVYIPLVHFKRYPKFLKKATLHLQLLLEVAPADRNV